MIIVEYWQDGPHWYASIDSGGWQTTWTTSAAHYTKRGLIRTIHRFINSMNPVEEVHIKERAQS